MAHALIAFGLVVSAFFAPWWLQLWLFGYLPYWFKEYESEQGKRDRKIYPKMKGRLAYFKTAALITFKKADTITAAVGSALAVGVLYAL